MRICIPVREKNSAQALRLFNRIRSQTKNKKEEFLVELWLDNFEENEVAALIKKSPYPVIAVCRGKIEKGSFVGSEQERTARLKQAVSAGAFGVDCGAATPRNLMKDLIAVCRKKRAKVIISEHFWKECPPLEELEKKTHLAKKLGADIVKIAVAVTQWHENVILFELMTRLKLQKIPAIILGMGERGKISRLACTLLGGYLSYVALDRKHRTAPGQWTLKEFLILN